jgi:hypothetical protein
MVTSSDLSRGQKGYSGIHRRRLQRKYRVFFITNGIILSCIALAVLTNPHANSGAAAYVALLSLVCTIPLLFATSYRGRGSLMIMFLAYYFATFGLSDLVGLFAYHPTTSGTWDTMRSWGGAIAILIGALCFLFGYAVTTGLPVYRTTGWSAREWSPRASAILGVILWLTGALSSAALLFHGSTTGAPIHINPMIGGFLALLRYLQPVGSLLLIYLYLTTRSKKILAVLLATMALDVGLGFFSGSKELAIRAPILFLLGVLLLRERIPVFALVVFTLGTALFFNLSQEFRNEFNQFSRWNTSSNVAHAKLAAGTETLLNSNLPLSSQFTGGLDYFVKRISQKWVIDLLVDRTGDGGVPYKDGATLTPLFYIFIPRFIAPNKPNNVVGQIFNRAFSISTPNTFIAITNLGDLYWNFGWVGIVVGMTIIGAFMAWAATKFRLDTGLTLPRFLFLVVTIYFLILRFEGGISLIYTLWARVAVVLLLIHAMMPKLRDRTGPRQRIHNGVQGPNQVQAETSARRLRH